jgi:hypothetical protein
MHRSCKLSEFINAKCILHITPSHNSNQNDYQKCFNNYLTWSYILMFTMLGAAGTSGTGWAALLVDPATFVTATVILSYIFQVVLCRVTLFWLMPWMQRAAHHDHSLSWVASPICWPVTHHNIKVSAALLHSTSVSLIRTTGEWCWMC